MINDSTLKIVGLAATAIGMGATFVSNWVDNKQLDIKIEEKVIEALAKQDKRGS